MTVGDNVKVSRLLRIDAGRGIGDLLRMLETAAPGQYRHVDSQGLVRAQSTTWASEARSVSTC